MSDESNIDAGAAFSRGWRAYRQGLSCKPPYGAGYVTLPQWYLRGWQESCFEHGAERKRAAADRELPPPEAA